MRGRAAYIDGIAEEPEYRPDWRAAASEMGKKGAKKAQEKVLLRKRKAIVCTRICLALGVSLDDLETMFPAKPR